MTSPATPAIVFDIGNVLLRFDFSVAAQRMAEQSAASASEIIPLLSPFKEDLESGNLPDAEFIRLASEKIGFRGTPAEFAHFWSDIFTVNEPMARLVAAYAGKAPLYLLSNTNGLHKDFFLAEFPVFRHFSGGVYSHEARSMKPHEPIYRHTVETLGLDPARLYYIDDLADNIATARRLGWTSHHYFLDQHDALEADLQRWLRTVAH